MDSAEKATRFLSLHSGASPLLMPNAWDAGSARILESLGFQALATTSSGFAATLGRPDGGVSRDDALAHIAAVAAAVDVPVSADLENCFADEPERVAETVSLAVASGVAGCSIEDYSRSDDDPIYDLSFATERVAAAADAAHRNDIRLILTARAENYLHGRRDLNDTIKRLQAYEQAGADVLFAPGVVDAQEIRAMVIALGKPVSVLALPGTPPVAELAAIGVRRVSVGGAFAFVAYGAAVGAAVELREHGTFGYLSSAAANLKSVKAAFRR